MIIVLQAKRESTPEKIFIFTAVQLQPHAEDLWQKLLEKLSREDVNKEQELLTGNTRNQDPHCFKAVETAIGEKCVHQEVN